MTIELNRDNYESETSQSEIPVLVDLWGPQCQPCLALMPAVEKMEDDYKGKIKICKLDVTKNRMTCVRLKVMSVPTFIIYNNGTEQDRLTGQDITENDIRSAIENVVKG